MLSRFLDWLDEAAAGLIRVAYLLAGITAVAVYFGAGHLPAGVQAVLDAALPWVLAAAVEIHTYLSARRVRSAWQDMQASARASGEHEKAKGALKVNLGVLAFLVAFSCWNQLNYLYDTWTPPHTALALPGWLAYVVRALVVPAAFMAAAFLAPLALPIAAQIEAEARATLADVFKIARRQRRKMLQVAEREGRDMTGALVELVTDAELRRIISHAYNAIAAAPSTTATILNAPQHASALNLSEQPTAPSNSTPTPLHPPLERASDVPAADTDGAPHRPPTGPGSPVTSKSGRPQQKQRQATRMLRLTPDRPMRKGVQKERAAGKKIAARGSAEQRVRTLLEVEPTIQFADLVRRADVSESTASKWLAVIEAECEAATQQQAVQ